LPILGLVGGRDLSRIDWQRVEALAEELREINKATDPLVRHAEGVAMLVLGPLPVPPDGPVNRLANACLEMDAGRNIIGMQAPWFVGIPLAEYVRDIQRGSQLLLPTHLRMAHDAGQFFLTLEVAAKLKLPALRDLTEQAFSRTPTKLRLDKHADWRQWPMSLKPLNP
jgi:hypothetical protein